MGPGHAADSTDERQDHQGPLIHDADDYLTLIVGRIGPGPSSPW